MIERLLTLPERRAGLVIIALALLFAIAYGGSLILRPKPSGRIVIGDATHHYVQLRSMVFDRDLHFRNEYFALYGLKGDEPDAWWLSQETATGHVRNLMPVGPALVWLPLFLATSAAVAAANLLGFAYPLDGYGRLFQATAGFSGIAAASLGIWISWRLCRRVFGARPAAWGALTAWLASPAIYYSVISPTYSHATSLLAVSVFWYAWLETRQKTPSTRYAALGAVAGVAALMRWQDAILFVPIGIEIVAAVFAARLTVQRGLGQLAIAGLCGALAFAPQMAVWWVLYGQPLAIPQGPEFMRWTAPALGQILFSDFHGLLTWTPAIALCLAGFVPLWRADRNLAVYGGIFLLTSWYVNAAVADWWAGEAFGARRFISCVPLFALGLSALIHAWAPTLRQVTLASGAIVAHTFLLLLQYQLFMHGLRDVAPYPRGAYELWLARFVVPFDIVRAWVGR